MDREHDPAFQAVDEAGGGVAEGFEQSEAELIDRSQNWEGRSPMHDAFPSEEQGTVEHDTADHERSSEEQPASDQDW